MPTIADLRRALPAVLLTLVVVTAAWARPAPLATQAACRAGVSGEFTVTLRQGGLVRSALVHVPHFGAGRALPVVLAFHGAGGSGPFMAEYSELSPLADHDHFIVVYPSAAGQRHFWTLNGDDPSKPDDVGFISKLLDLLPQRVCMDVKRVYATGVSNGGGFTARLGCELSSRIAAIAPVAGGYRSLDPCHPDRPVSVLEIHGTADPVVPYNGKAPDYKGSVPRFLSNWATIDQCPQPATPIFVARGTERFDWGPCAAATEVMHLKLKGIGHTWPGSRDSRSAPIETGRTVWRFFRGRVLAPAYVDDGGSSSS
jgi:polyhydroxybutyrate depolymerase